VADARRTGHPVEKKPRWTTTNLGHNFEPCGSLVTGSNVACFLHHDPYGLADQIHAITGTEGLEELQHGTLEVGSSVLMLRPRTREWVSKFVRVGRAQPLLGRVTRPAAFRDAPEPHHCICAMS
jgi:hypothetical protein